MDRMWGVMQVVLPVVAILLAGALVRRKKLATAEGMGQLKGVLVNICLPAVLFRTFYAMEFNWKETGIFFLMGGVTLTGFLLGFLMRRLLRARYGILPWLCTTIEGGSIGYALFILLFGQSNLYHLALLDAGNAMIQWSIVMTVLAMRGRDKQSPGQIARSLISPINVAIAAGLLLSVTGLGRGISATQAGKTLEAVLDFMGAPVSAMIMLAVGFDLRFEQIEWKETMKAVLSRAAVYALLGTVVYLLLGRMSPEDGLYSAAALIYFILPPTFAYSVYVKEEKESAYLGGFLGVYTLLTIAAFVLLAALRG